MRTKILSLIILIAVVFWNEEGKELEYILLTGVEIYKICAKTALVSKT